MPDEVKREDSIQEQSPQRDSSDVEAISADAQAGIQKVEAITKVWSKKALITAYVL
jgi:hypothetical protein